MSPGMAYFDNAATTMTLPEVAEEMRPYFTEMYGNPSSLHEMGAEAAAAVRTARKRMADAFGCYPSEVFFTAGGTEADNMAILGTLPEGGGRVVTSAIEHSAVLESPSTGRVSSTCPLWIRRWGTTCTWSPSWPPTTSSAPSRTSGSAPG